MPEGATASVAAFDVPQMLPAVTVMLPAVELGVVVMLFVVEPAVVHPIGSVQV